MFIREFTCALAASINLMSNDVSRGNQVAEHAGKISAASIFSMPQGTTTFICLMKDMPTLLRREANRAIPKRETAYT